MKVLFAGQVPKDPSFPEAIEDAYALAPEAGRIAVSDGASESFDSKTWASLLATRFVRHPELSEHWLAEAIADYAGRFNAANLSWSKLAAFERGSFATLLGLEQRGDHTIDVFAVGDSLAVLLDGHERVEAFPYVRAIEFQQRPELFCTNTALNTFFASPDVHHRTWSIRERGAPMVLCMTDALAEWALRNEEEGRPVWGVLAGVDRVSDLENLVRRERQARAIRIDDTTLVRVSFGRLGRDALPNPGTV
jgi:Protein phosphatase 2C